MKMLRMIDGSIDCSFFNKRCAPLDGENVVCPAVEPQTLCNMLFVRDLYDICSECQLEEEMTRKMTMTRQCRNSVS